MLASGRENAMSDSVYKVIEVVGTAAAEITGGAAG
jgi:flavin-binding protein dodecin